mmetsp:Transcript_3790/g.10441  ORF Transcript_3790/g.10441 Transcript_3790/m.10441 type:complete len:118 (+) Transcript_3790:113-466(+)
MAQNGVAVETTKQEHTGPDGQTTTTTSVGVSLRNQTSDGQRLFPRPTHITCPHCQADCLTRAESQGKSLAQWAGCCGLCLIGCWLGCCLIPFCVNDLGTFQHSCSSCGKFVGEYRII